MEAWSGNKGKSHKKCHWHEVADPASLVAAEYIASDSG